MKYEHFFTAERHSKLTKKSLPLVIPFEIYVSDSLGKIL